MYRQFLEKAFAKNMSVPPVISGKIGFYPDFYMPKWKNLCIERYNSRV